MKKSFVALALCLAAANIQAQTPQQIVQKFYPKYSQKHRCYQVNVKDRGEYCVRQIKSETRQTAQGRLMYLLFTGNVFDFKTGKEDGAHVQSGLAGVFVLKQTDNDWTLLAAQPRGSAGAYGNAPDAKDWSFHEFGRDKWGFLTRHFDVHQGYAGSAYMLFVHDGAKKMTDSVIIAEADSTGALGDDCSENLYEGRKNTAAERRACLNKLYKLSSKIKILKDGNANAGFYPLQLTVSGFDGLKKYNNKIFISTYNAAKGRYTTPQDYPLADKEF